MDKLRIYSAAVLSMVCWALSFVWVKVAYHTLEPMTVVTLRMLGASIIMLSVGLTFKMLQPIKQGDVKYFLLLAFFEPFLYFMGESFGMKLVSSTLGAVIISTIPLFAPFAGLVFAKERLNANHFIGIGVSLTGVFLIVFDADSGFGASGMGVMLMFLAVFAAVFYTVMLRKLTHHYTGYTIVSYQSIIGFFYFIPFFFIFDWSSLHIATISRESIHALIQLTIFASVFAFLLFTYSVKRMGITRANAFVNLIPAITYAFAIFILDEAFDARKVLGIFVVIGGLFVSQLKIGQKKAPLHGERTA